MSTLSLKDEMWHLPHGQPDGDLECVEIGGGGCNRRPCQGVTPPVNFLPEHFGIPRPKDTSNCNPRRPMPEDKDAEGPAPTAPSAPQLPIGSKPLNAEAQVFKPNSSSPSPTLLGHVMSEAKIIFNNLSISSSEQQLNHSISQSLKMYHPIPILIHPL